MRTIKYITAILVIFGFTACEDYLDVNNNPASITDPSPELTLAAGQLGLATFLQNNYNETASFWVQYYTRAGNIAGVDNRDQYDILPGDNRHANTFIALLAGNTTRLNASGVTLPQGSLGDIQVTATNALAAGDLNTWAVAELIKAYSFQVLVDMFDKVPYSEALDKLIIAPKYDEGSDVYEDLIVKIDAALAEIDPTATIAGDLIFDGNMGMWVKFANTLKLRIYMRQSEVNPSLAETGVASLTVSDLFAPGEEAEILFDHSTPTSRHPDGLNDINVQLFTAASNTIVSYMLTHNDPRVDAFFRAPVVAASDNPGGAQRGVIQGRGTDLVGSEAGLDFYSARGEFLIGEGSSAPLFSSSETQFLLAEAAARGWIGGSAESYYEAGIAASFARTESGSALAYITNEAPYPNGSFNQNLAAIMEEKWVSMTGRQGLEMWSEWRRTGYPDNSIIAVSPISVLPSPATDFPLRFPYIQNEYDNNSKNVPTLEGIQVPVWWDN